MKTSTKILLTQTALLGALLTIDIWGSGILTISELVKIGDDSSPS